jgi:methionyl-tRNA synthetase
MQEVEFGKDGDFSEERFINIVNANLANAIGTVHSYPRHKTSFAYHHEKKNIVRASRLGSFQVEGSKCRASHSSQH